MLYPVSLLVLNGTTVGPDDPSGVPAPLELTPVPPPLLLLAGGTYCINPIIGSALMLNATVQLLALTLKGVMAVQVPFASSYGYMLLELMEHG